MPMNKFLRGLVFILLILIMSYPLIHYVWLAPDSTHINAVASIAVALATLLLAIIAFWQILESRDQIRRAEYASLRPLLIPSSSFDHKNIQDSAPDEISFKVRNVGNGVATNVWGLVFPADESQGRSTNQRGSRPDNPIAVNDNVDFKFIRGTAFNQSDQIANIPMVPEKILRSSNPLKRSDQYVARLTLTYSDVFGLKHASFFDLTNKNSWVCVAVKNNISSDLGDLNEKISREFIERSKNVHQ